jgi:hypothetical protein
LWFTYLESSLLLQNSDGTIVQFTMDITGTLTANPQTSSEFDFRLDYIGTVAGIQMLLPKQLATDVHRNYDLLWQP